MNAAILLVLTAVTCALATATGPPKLAVPKLGIVGGNNATRDQFPYQASLQKQSGGRWKHHCGASVIGRNYVLTVASCFDISDDPANYRLVTGILDIDDVEIGEQTTATVGIIPHVLFPGGPVAAPYDIALVKLEALLNWTTSVQPVALPSADIVVSSTAALSGWGAVKDDFFFQEMPTRLQYADLPIITELECDQILNRILDGRPHPLNVVSNLCSGSTTGYQAACVGDSGDPLVDNGKIIGMVSWGITPCAGYKDAPTVYTKVAAFIDWVLTNAPDIQI